MLDKQESFEFEFSFSIRDNLGNISNKRKEIKTNDVNKLWLTYWNQIGVHEYQTLKKKARTNSKNPEVLAEAELARELLKLIYDE